MDFESVALKSFFKGNRGTRVCSLCFDMETHGSTIDAFYWLAVVEKIATEYSMVKKGNWSLKGSRAKS